ncbi:HAD family hydrolase [Stigmatella aurantiaca]|uniref:HAD-superfamily hydrolase, subfamily IA n=1 Tax=Stigmatella aurantiaca (strain DW4/3-1) TaxID=378806 RepID=Q09AR3_STIAD|nr:HAD family phosphatase [Stigmatella aurantiaca]ADO74857.1 HAD-superfamily hydrolase, subfamily IA [Stigmatella aurantiaca DW4/3-1]EAU68774.1 putative hydrolase [Stigmatella aurantiaca DW4/3-1]
MPPPRALLFDLGNVLVFHDNGLLFHRLGARAGLPPREVAQRLTGAGWTAANRGQRDAEGIRRDVCGALGVELPMEEFAPLWSSHFTVHEAVLPRVEALEGRVKRVLVSNTNVLHVAYLRPRLPLLQRFDALLMSCEVGLVKPEPAFFQLALERAGCAPHEAAFFDDLPEYVEAANALGIRGHLFTDAPTFDAQLKALGL